MPDTRGKSQINARLLPRDEQVALRIRGVELLLEGWTRAAAARELGVSVRQVRRWARMYDEGGWEELSQRRSGRSSESQMLLGAEQQERLIALIKNNRPDELGLPGSRWTHKAVRDLIERECGWQPGLGTVGRYLRRWGFPPSR